MINETPWPATRPNPNPAILHGWFTDKNAEMLSRFCGPATRCIIEIGSWYGMSARWFAERCPAAQIYCIDPWLPYPEVSENPEWAALQPAAFENFVNNLWPYRDRVHILKTYSILGLDRCFNTSVQPDLIYVDGDHTKDAVHRDVFASRLFFPKAVLVGDDSTRVSVSDGLIQAIPEWNYINDLQDNGQCWALDVANLTPQG